MNSLDLTKAGLIRALSPSLEEQLGRAERDLVCAQMIDEWSRCQRETELARARIASIKKQMEERDAE